MSSLYLYDDARARGFEPFASCRPISELVSGISTIRERWQIALQGVKATHYLAGQRHADFDEGSASVAAKGMVPAGAIVVNARAVPALPADIVKLGRYNAGCSVWRCGQRLAGIRLREATPASAFEDGVLTLEDLAAGTGGIGDMNGWWLDEVWDLVRVLPEQLANDLAQMAQSPGTLTNPPTHATVIGDKRVMLAEDVVIEPHVVFDTTDGAIYVGRGSHLRSFTRITGPCYLGREVTVMGGDITGSSIGDVSKVRGEISATTIVGHSNKGHEGFVGHSYIGRWVNLGAGTVTSNLKNTYGTVALWTPQGRRDTGLQFLGTLFGDHVKTGIGLRLTTGTVLGAGANVYGNMPPKVVAPFSWGDAPPYTVYHADKFVETAQRMMSRRHVELTERARRHLEAMHAGRWKVSDNPD
ncbi:MAG TPA: putative sugar nucleotidyl transferase [Gemmatimonadaceae bacterium]|nr:putative sugar nucleotidyl transferase [Gemmatimonadaceae bacterium]